MYFNKLHSIANDIKEGEAIFGVSDVSQALAVSAPIYYVSALAGASGKIIPVVFDTRLTQKDYVAKGADYASNLSLPAEFIAMCVPTGTNSVVNPAGSGAVIIVKANLTNIGDSTITIDKTIATVTGVANSTSVVVPPPVVLPPPVVETAEQAAARIKAAADKVIADELAKKKLANAGKFPLWGKIVAGAVALVLAVWAGMTYFKK